MVTTMTTDPTGANSMDSGFKTSMDSGTYHLQLVADWSPESFGSALTNGVSALLIDATGLESQLDGSVARNRELQHRQRNSNSNESLRMRMRKRADATERETTQKQSLESYSIVKRNSNSNRRIQNKKERDRKSVV